jgi:hypothetical protein
MDVSMRHIVSKALYPHVVLTLAEENFALSFLVGREEFGKGGIEI